MKKIICCFLVGIMVFSFAACGGETKKYDPEEDFKREVQIMTEIKCRMNYADVNSVKTNLDVITVSENVYRGQGTVTIIDDYANTYIGKISAESKFHEEEQKFGSVNVNIETPTKKK